MELYYNVAFCVWLLSLSIMFLRFFMVLHVSVLHFFSWLSNIPLYEYTTLVHPFVTWWTFVLFSTFWLLWIVLLWTLVCCYEVFVWIPVFNDLVYIPRSGISGLYGNAMFSFLRNRQTVFHSGCTVYISTSNVWGCQFPYILANTCYFLFLFCFIFIYLVFIVAILVGVK